MSQKNAMLSLLVGGLLMGCGGDVGPVGAGSLSLEWDVRPRGCESAGVETVSVQLDGAERIIETFDCTDGAADIDDLAPGNYELSLIGMNDRRQRIFWAEPSRVTIQGQRVTEVEPVNLTARPAEIDVFWVFDNGRVCGANDVDEVEIALFDKLDYEISRDTYACDEGVAPLTGFAAGTYVVEVTAQIAGIDAWRGTQGIVVDRGEEAQVEVSLQRR